MSSLRELYQETIIDHSRHPRNFGFLPNATSCKEGFNPLCGDKLFLMINEKNGIIENIKFEGSGCAISLASASLMTECVKGKTLQEFEALFLDFHALLTGQGDAGELKQSLGKLVVLAGVSEFPVRVKCATLAWHTLKAALLQDAGIVSTEET